MVCDEAKRFVYFFFDKELAELRQKDLQGHYDRCSECGRRLTIHRRLRLFIQRRLQRLAAPSRLHERIRLKLRNP